MPQTLYDKVFDAHVVEELEPGQFQLFVGLHYVNDVTSAEAFAALERRGLSVAHPQRTVAVADHMVATDDHRLRLSAPLEVLLRRHALATGVDYVDIDDDRHGIVHVIGPELGLTQPGMTVCCGDSHTSTHGAVGALAFGIGTTQVRDVLATQTVAVRRLAVRQVVVGGAIRPGVEAKDVILRIIADLGVGAGAGHAYEFAGDAITGLGVEDRMTLCNMSIEGGAQIGYVNPDDSTFTYLRGRPYAPAAPQWDQAVRWWQSLVTDRGAPFADRHVIDGDSIEPMVTWGMNPGQAVPVTAALPAPEALGEGGPSAEEAYRFMGFSPRRTITGTPIDVAFIGSCANGRLADIERAVQVVRATGGRVASHVRALVVPGSARVHREMVRLGYDDELRQAGFDVRRPGCSMCVGMNGDALVGRELCASTSTRNFKGRQGSPTGRTLLMSASMVAAAALAGEVVDVRAVAAPSHA